MPGFSLGWLDAYDHDGRASGALGHPLEQLRLLAYSAVHRSTGFEIAEKALPNVAGAYAHLVAAALPFYDRLIAHRLRS